MPLTEWERRVCRKQITRGFPGHIPDGLHTPSRARYLRDAAQHENGTGEASSPGMKRKGPPLTEEERRLRRKEINRESARRIRLRKNNEMERLKHQVVLSPTCISHCKSINHPMTPLGCLQQCTLRHEWGTWACMLAVL